MLYISSMQRLKYEKSAYTLKKYACHMLPYIQGPPKMNDAADTIKAQWFKKRLLKVMLKI